PPPRTVQCFSDVPPHDFAGGSSTGTCGTVTVAWVSDTATNGNSSCNNVITRTYRATDSNGNTAECTQTITVNDDTPPTISGTGSNELIQCPATPNFSTPSASDACDPSSTLTFADVTTPGNCPQNYSVTRTWRASDHCGNSSTSSQTI